MLECVVTAYELVNTLAKEKLLPSNIIDEKIMSTIKSYAQDEDSFDDNIDADALKTELKQVMWNKVGISRTETSLNKALEIINEIENEFTNSNPQKSKYNTVSEYELRNMIYVAKCIINAALNRKESIGAHYRADFEPQRQTNTISSEFGEKTDDSKIIA